MLLKQVNSRGRGALLLKAVTCASRALTCSCAPFHQDRAKEEQLQVKVSDMCAKRTATTDRMSDSESTSEETPAPGPSRPPVDLPKALRVAEELLQAIKNAGAPGEILSIQTAPPPPPPPPPQACSSLTAIPSYPPLLCLPLPFNFPLLSSSLIHFLRFFLPLPYFSSYAFLPLYSIPLFRECDGLIFHGGPAE